MTPFLGKRISLFVLVPVWIFLVAIGVSFLYRYENGAGIVAQAPGNWPVDIPRDQIALAQSGPTLLVFIHPRCPCSVATLGELERLVASTRDHMRTHVVFWYPDQASPDWLRSALRTQAALIPGIHCMDDMGGDITRRFGVVTSGQSLLYSAEGQLLFAGGITKSRGHFGDNVGSDTIRTIALTAGSNIDEPVCSDVFGCSLVDPQNISAVKP